MGSAPRGAGHRLGPCQLGREMHRDFTRCMATPFTAQPSKPVSLSAAPDCCPGRVLEPMSKNARQTDAKIKGTRCLGPSVMVGWMGTEREESLSDN